MANFSGKIIGFDLDGVIIDHTDLKIQLAKKLGRDLKPEQTPSEIIKEIVPEPQLKELQYFLYDDPNVSIFNVPR